MIARALFTLAAAVALTGGDLAAQVAAAHPLLDSARLFAAEWEVTALVRADSTARDSTTLRRIEWAHWLGPRRIVYAGQLAAGDQRALLGWVDGRVTLLAVDGREFTAPNGRNLTVRFGQGWRLPSQFFAGAGSLYVSTPTGRGFSVYATDGERWRAVIHREDSVIVRGRKVSVGSARVIDVDARGRPILVMETDAVDGIVRLEPAGIVPIVADRDTLADGAVLPAGITHLTFGMWRFFRAAGDQWSILFRGRNTDLYGTAGGASRLLARSSERMPDDSTRDWQDIRSAFPLEDGRFALLVRRGGSLLVGRPGMWRVAATGTAWQRERAGVFAIGDATAVDSAGVLIALVQGQQELISGRIEGRFVDLYHFDGTTVRALPWDSLLGTTVRDMRRNTGGGFEMTGEIEFRRIPGYSARVVVTTPLRHQSVSGGRFRPAELLYDPASRRLVPMPSLRAAGRDPVSIGDIIGWNSADEAVAALGREIAVLRRRP